MSRFFILLSIFNFEQIFSYRYQSYPVEIIQGNLIQILDCKFKGLREERSIFDSSIFNIHFRECFKKMKLD